MYTCSLLHFYALDKTAKEFDVTTPKPDKTFLGKMKDAWHGADKWTEKHPYLTQAAAMAGGMGLGALANWGVNAMRHHGDHGGADAGAGAEHQGEHPGDQASSDPRSADVPSGHGAVPDSHGGGVDPIAGATHHGQVWRSEVGNADVWRLPDGSHVYKTQDGSWLRSSTPSWGEPDSLWHSWTGNGWSRGHVHPGFTPGHR